MSSFSRYSGSHCSRLSRWIACSYNLLSPLGSEVDSNPCLLGSKQKHLSLSIWEQRQRIWPAQGFMSPGNTVLWASSCFYLFSTVLRQDYIDDIYVHIASTAHFLPHYWGVTPFLLTLRSRRTLVVIQGKMIYRDHTWATLLESAPLKSSGFHTAPAFLPRVINL